MSVKTTYRQGRTEFDATAFQDYAQRHVIKHTDLATNVTRIPVDAGKHVLGVRLHVAAAFTGATSVKIGDGADDDGYFEIGDIDPTALNAVMDSRMLASEDAGGVATFNAFAKGGKFYATPGFILVTFAGTLTAGQLVLEVLYNGYQPAARDELVNQ